MVQRSRQSTETAWCSTPIVRGRQLFSFSSDAVHNPRNWLCAQQSRELCTVPQSTPPAQMRKVHVVTKQAASMPLPMTMEPVAADRPGRRRAYTMGCCRTPLAAQIGISAKPPFDGRHSEQGSRYEAWRTWPPLGPETAAQWATAAVRSARCAALSDEHHGGGGPGGPEPAAARGAGSGASSTWARTRAW